MNNIECLFIEINRNRILFDVVEHNAAPYKVWSQPVSDIEENIFKTSLKMFLEIFKIY